MADTAAVIRIKAVDEGFISTTSNASMALAGLTAASMALDFGLTKLQKISTAQSTEFLIGTKNAEKFAGSLTNLIEKNSKAISIFGTASDLTFAASQLGLLTKGAQDAIAAYSKIPLTLQLANTSGVSTKGIEQFNMMTEAVRGSDVALDQFAVDAVAKLGQFEQAAARAGTILRSSINFDEFGQAKRANIDERIKNAFEVQDLVTKELKNSVSSTSALIGQYEVLSGGFTKAADSQSVLTAGLKLVGIGQAGGQATDPAETLRLITKTLSAYSLGAGEAARVGGILNSVVENGLTTIPELSQNFGQTGQTAKAAGVSLTDLGASTAVLTAQGIGTSSALTGLQRVFSSIISKTPDAEQALSKLSLDGRRIRFDLPEIQAKGFTKALLDLNKAASGNIKVLQDIFPEDVAFRTVLGLLTKDGEKLANVSQSVADSTAKSLDDVFNIATGDRVNRLQQIANRFQELIIKVAQSIVPVFEPGIKTLETIADVFANLPEPVKSAIGQFIAFQITTKATVGAVGILFNTLLELAGGYLEARAICLVLTGEFGREAAVIGQLITQKKGLLAATLQLFGVDQRYQLSTEATTGALEKQSFAARALAATRGKIASVGQRIANANLEGYREQVVIPLAPVAQSAKNTLNKVTGKAGELFEGAIALTPDPVQNFYKKARDAAASTVTGVRQSFEKIPTIPDPWTKEADAFWSVEHAKQKVGNLVKGADESLRKFPKLPDPFDEHYEEKLKHVNDYEARVSRIGIRTPANLITAQDELPDLIGGNSAFLAAQAKVESALQRELVLQKELQVGIKRLESVRVSAAETAIASEEAKQKALLASASDSLSPKEKQQIINKAVQAQVASSEAENKASELEDRTYKRKLDLEKQRSLRIDSQTELSAREEELSPKYIAAAEKQALARRFNAQAINFEEKAELAKIKADELERVASVDPDNIELQTKARTARASATALETKASQLQTRAESEAAIATQLATAIDKEAILAEQGLAETRIFGRTVLYSTLNPLSSINAILSTEIQLTEGLTAVTKVATFIQGGFANVTGFLGKTLDLTKGGILSLGKAVGGGLSNSLTSILGTLGPLAPLLLVVGGAAFLLRDQIWGLGGASRDLSKQLREVREEGDKLTLQFGRDDRLINFKSQVIDLQNTLAGKPIAISQGVAVTATKTLKDSEKGIFDSIGDFGSKTIGNIGNAIASPFGKLDSSLKKAANPDLNVKNTSGDSLNPIRKSLDELRNSGDLTTGQFAQLADSLNKVGESGTINADKLQNFKLQLDAIRAGGTGKVEKGILDSTGDFFKAIPGAIGGGIDRTANLVGGFIANPIRAINPFTAVGNVESVGQNRQADSLVQPLSEMGLALNDVGEQALRTSMAVDRYKKGLFQVGDLNEKVAQNQKITAEDFEKEEKKFKEFQKINEQKISGYEKTIEQQKKVLEGIKDPELKKIFQDRIDLLETERDKLDKGNELLKQRYEIQTKYYKETLPALTQALSETANPNKLLTDSESLFKQKYIIDAKGNSTKLFKGINLLRTESEKYRDQVVQSYESGLFSKREYASGTEYLGNGIPEKRAASKLRDIRDDQITVGGVKGYTLSVAQRKELTKQIVDFEQSSSTQRAESYQLQIEQEKTAGVSKVKSAQEVERKVAELQIQTNKETLAQKEAMIKEYENQNFRTTDLEREASKIRIQIATEEAELVEKIRNQKLQLQEQDLNTQIQKDKALASQRRLAPEQEEDRIAQAEIQKTRNKLAVLTEDFLKGGARSPELANEITQAQAQIDIQVEDDRNRRRDRKLKQDKSLLDTNISGFKAEAAAHIITSDQADDALALTQIKGQKRQLQDLDVQLNAYKKNGVRNVELENGAAQLRNQIREAEAQNADRIYARTIERRKTAIANQVLAETQILQQQSNRSDFRSKQLELSQQLSSANQQSLDTQSQYNQAVYQNQIKFTGDIVKRAELERSASEERLRSLSIAQGYERQSLLVQQQQNRLALDREIIANRIAKLENQRSIAQSQLDLEKAKRDRKPEEDIKALELQIDGLNQQGEVLNNQSATLDHTATQQQEINKLNLQELFTKQATASLNSENELRLARIKEIQAEFERQALRIDLIAQRQNLLSQNEIRASEQLTKQYEQQLQLLEGAQNLSKGKADAVIGELAIASEVTNSEKEKASLAKLTASIKLRSLSSQLVMEKQVLELNLAQQAASLEREKIQNRVAQATNKADVAKAQAEVQKLRVDPTASPEAIAAAQLAVSAKIEEGIALQYGGKALEQQQFIQQQLAGYQREGLQDKQSLAVNQAKLEYAKTLDPSQKKKAFRQLDLDSLSAATGFNPEYIKQNRGELESAINAYSRQTTARFFTGFNGGLEPLEADRANQIQGRLGDIAPPSLPNIPDYNQFRASALAKIENLGVENPTVNRNSVQLQGELTSALADLKQLVEKKLGSPSTVNVSVPITNNFTPENQNAADTVTQQFRQQFYDFGVLLQNR